MGSIDGAKASISKEILDEIASGQLEGYSAQEILSWGLKSFGSGITLSASFGAPEGMLLLDMMHRIDASARVFVLDTGRMHPATYDLIDRVRDRYDKAIDVVMPDARAVGEMVREKGMNLFYESLDHRQLCCRLRKVEPMRAHLGGYDAYVTGLRRDQNVTRRGAPRVSIDANAGGLVKVSPLVDWTIDDVWQYVRKFDVPVNRLHAEGYPSVGCAPCSRAIAPGDDIRAGRWWWENEDTKECGLHPSEQADGSGI